MAEFSVESIGQGRKRGVMKVFSTRQEANRFAGQELRKNRGVVIDKLTNYGQRTVAQKNMKITGLGKGKYGKQFVADYGHIAKSRNYQQRPMFGFMPQGNFNMFAVAGNVARRR